MKVESLKCPQCGSTQVIKEGSIKFPKITCEDCNQVTKPNGKVEKYHKYWPNRARDPKRDTGDYLEHLIDHKD